MKYEIVLITKQGIVTEIYDSEEMTVADFESAMVSKYTSFFMQSSKPIEQ